MPADPTAHRSNLIHALEGIAKFDDAADPSAMIGYMDTSEELYLRWNGAYVRRAWFLSQFSASQQTALAEFAACYDRLAAKYKKFPPLLKFVVSSDGRDLCARASHLLQLLRRP